MRVEIPYSQILKKFDGDNDDEFDPFDRHLALNQNDIDENRGLLKEDSLPVEDEYLIPDDPTPDPIDMSGTISTIVSHATNDS